MALFAGRRRTEKPTTLPRYRHVYARLSDEMGRSTIALTNIRRILSAMAN